MGHTKDDTPSSALLSAECSTGWRGGWFPLCTSETYSFWPLGKLELLRLVYKAMAGCVSGSDVISAPSPSVRTLLRRQYDEIQVIQGHPEDRVWTIYDGQGHHWWIEAGSWGSTGFWRYGSWSTSDTSRNTILCNHNLIGGLNRSNLMIHRFT